MNRNRIKKNFIIISFIAVVALYLGLVLFFIRVDTFNRFRSILLALRNADFLKRIPLYLLEYFSCILYFCTCLLYIKKNKCAFYVCEFITLISIVFCLKFNLPLLPRDVHKYRMIWQIDAIEYLYPISYLGMLLFLLFFPVFFDLLKCVTKGKKILIFLSVFTTVSVDLVTIISMICHAIECRIFKDMLVFSCMTFVKIILLVFIYRLLIHTEKMQMERYSFGYLSIIKFVLPLIIVLLFAFSKISIKNSGVFILRNAEIDGYWFIGSIEAFIENYENPYQDKRYYLDYKLVEEKKSEEIKEGYEWYFDEEQNCQFIKTFGRKLEGIYYLNEFTLEESETSNLHKYELSKRFAGCREDVKDYRAVLSSEEYEHTVFYYRITSNMEYQPIYIYDSDGKNVPRAIETYDILIDTKEIPAYFLGMVDCYGIVKVESYVHYWGENPFQIGINIYRKLQTVRQY